MNGSTSCHDTQFPEGGNGTLTVDMELDTVVLEPRALAPTQEDALVMRSHLTQGQSSPWTLEAKAVLVLPRFVLALALVQAEDECLLLLVDLRGRDREKRALGCLGAELPTHLCPPKSEHSQKTSPRG